MLRINKKITMPHHNHFILLILALCLIGSCKLSNDTAVKDYLGHVGDTVFDPKVDDDGFKVCHEDMVLQYYNFSNAIQYEGEKYAIEQAFKKNYKLDKISGENGFVSIRFIVNCEGDTGWFRVEQVDEAYEYKTFDESIIRTLLEITKSLDGWKKGEARDYVYDYYQYLTFKIEDGWITEITP